MNPLKLFVTSLLLLTSVGVLAEKVTVNTTEFEPGGTINMSVSLENAGTVSGYTMKLYLPEGFSILFDKESYVYELSDRHDKDYSMTLTKASDCSYLFIVYSSKSADAIKGKSGLLFSIKLRVEATVTTSKMARLESLVVSDANGNERTIDNLVFDLIRKVPPITVTARSCVRQYGEPNPAFGYEAAGGKLTGTPTITCEATATSSVGEYDIVVAEGSVTNSNVTYVNGKLTITKAPLALTAKSYTMKQGDPLPTMEVEYEGFKNGETEAVLDKLAVVSCDATSASVPGEYPITISGAEAENYEIAYANGTLTITDADAVIVAAKSYTREYGDANPTFEYDVEGAALKGTPEISCEATESSPVGTYPIIVKKGGVTNYNDTYVNGTLTITKAPLTVTAKSYTMKQGDPLPTMEVEYEGFKNGETEAVLGKQAAVSCDATSGSALGTYPITISGAEAENYEITCVSGKLTITEADAVMVAAKNYTREYGDANPVFEYDVDGAALEGVPEISCDATELSPVGTYPIVISKGSVKNYNDTYVNGMLTITKAPLTVTAKSYTMKQGDPLPTMEVEYKGFKNGETEAVLGKQVVVSCDATSGSIPGEYPITISGAEADNYEITYVNGTLTITDADAVIVAAKSYTREYGDANPVFEYDVEGAALEGTPEISCEATEASPVGTYPIIIKKGGVTNYNDTYVNGTLTITKAPLTVTVADAEREQGQDNPVFAISYMGWKNGETESVLTKRPVATTTATKDSPVGVYDIVVSGGEAQNYELIYVGGKLTVTVLNMIADLMRPDGTFDVYTLTGQPVRLYTKTLKGLAKGVYIVNGKKLMVK